MVARLVVVVMVLLGAVSSMLWLVEPENLPSLGELAWLMAAVLVMFVAFWLTRGARSGRGW
ncbi:MAG: hypothetical protein AAGD38_16370 [Acidobacteriota bacterium]